MGTLHLYLEERAKATPEMEAIVSGKQRFTYQEWNERVNQLAKYLIQIGVQKGDRVGILCKNSHPYPTILLATLRIGAIAIPLNWRLTAYEMEGMMKNAQPKVLFYDAEFAHSLELVKDTGLIDKLIMVARGLEITDEFAAIFTGQVSTLPAQITLADDDLAFILYTSGTTGTAKGCMIAHGSYDTYLRESRRQTEPGMRFLAVHPLFHMSSTSLILYNVFCGNTMVFLADSDVTAILRTIEQEKINTMFAFPAVYSYLLEAINQQQWDLSSLQFVSAGGTHVPSALIKRFLGLGIPMTQGYGSTEAAFVSGWHPMMGLSTAESVGKPFKQVQVKIVDPASGKELPTGEIGEVLVKSPYVFKGYWKNPEATKQVLIDGWVHMGDAGQMDEYGNLYISGRYKEMILHGGDNVYPGEVEEVIHRIAGVMEVAVVGIPDERMGEVPRAYIVKKSGHPLTAAEITKACKQKLAEYKIPEVVFVEELPKNGLGKVMKHVLKEQQTKQEMITQFY